MSQAKAGALVMPWDSGQYDEILVYMFVGLISGIVGSTLIHHYRKAFK